MFELNGKHNKCKVYTDNTDNETISQLMNVLNQESVSGSTIRIMPDCHAGAGCVIGTTMTIKDKVIPNLVGVDIGCGMHVVKLKEKRIEMPKLDSVIRKSIPSGGNNRDRDGKYADKLRLEELRCITKYHAPVRVSLARASNGTLGGGNHFIEIDKDKDDDLYLIVHTGSRHLGIEICNFYQEAAYQRLKDLANDGSKKDKINKIINECKKEGKTKEIQKRLEAFNREYAEKNPSICYELAYCEGYLFDDYLHDMEIVQEAAYWNRKAICDIILKEMKLHLADEFETVHNYIDTEQMILRKGSVWAGKGERLIIPMNMRDGSLICIGKGNEDWNYSAPHGAGRLFSRSKAKDMLSVSEFRHEMEGIYTTSVGKGTIDESPMAYKPMDEIIHNIHETVEIIDVIKPIYNFKAGAEDE